MVREIICKPDHHDPFWMSDLILIDDLSEESPEGRDRAPVPELQERPACSTALRRFHASRHTAATLLLEAGVALEVVSAILGHSSIGVTAKIYTKVRSDLKRRGLDAPA